MIDPQHPPGLQRCAPLPQQLVAVPRRSALSVTTSQLAATLLVTVLCAGVSACHRVSTQSPRAPAAVTRPHPAKSADVDLSVLDQSEAPSIAGAALSSWTTLRSFYSHRQNQPAWLVNAAPTADAERLLAVLRTADQEGLRPDDYHVAALSNGRLTATERELLLTDAALRYAHDQLIGRFDPRQMDAAWFIAAPVAPDVAAALQAALTQQRLAAWLASLPSPHPAYAQLRTALARYRQLAAQPPWPIFEDGAALKPGDHDARVAALRKRLESSGELSPADVTDSTRYDAALASAVRRFQASHGVEPDGVIGKTTRAALNVPAAQRVLQLRANMERWRWLPRQFPARYILVNMAGFELQVEENDQPVMSMHVIVGKQMLSTPTFNSRLTHIVFNPYWTVPQSIAAKELLPILQKDPGYLAKEHLQVFDSWDADAQPLDPNAIDWSRYTAKHFPYRLRQLPGPHNSLGQVKFLLPNAYDIYLHDTPSRRLFNKSVRALSHGCIRVQNPNALAEYLLQGSAKWNPETIADRIAQRVTYSVALPRPIAIYMVYFTAWVDAAGDVQLRDDIYARDGKLVQAFGNEN